MAVLPKKYENINFRPPKAVAEQARRGLWLHQKFKRGGTAVGLARARDLKNRRKLSPSTINRVVSFFARHEVDKKGKDFYNRRRPSNGYIAWLLWGGDAGRRWAEGVKNMMTKADKRLK